jgi:dGTPase
MMNFIYKGKRQNMIKLTDQLASPEEYVIPRKRKEKYDVSSYRTEFQRDRDRILYCKSFRRMSGKTQIFLPSSDDHFRTRLTHSIEVMQIAKHIGSNLGLNQDLIESIALGHDIGHAPFGHVGERTLNLLLNGCDVICSGQEDLLPDDKGFKHNWQSVRALSKLLRIYGNYGLNLTATTLWGIFNHTKGTYKECEYYKNNYCYFKRIKKECKSNGNYSLAFYNSMLTYLNNNLNQPAWSLEGLIVAKSDEIAQRHHDIEDGLISKLITKKDIIKELPEILEKIPKFLKDKDKDELTHLLNKRIRGKNKDENELTTYLSKFILGSYSSVMIENCKFKFSQFINENKISNHEAFVQIYPSIPISTAFQLTDYPEDFGAFDKELQNTLTNNVLKSHLAQEMDGKGRFIIRNIIKAYLSNPKQLQDNTILSIFKIFDPKKYKFTSPDDSRIINKLRGDTDNASLRSESRFQIAMLRAVCDHIAGMTDNYAIAQNKKLYG